MKNHPRHTIVWFMCPLKILSLLASALQKGMSRSSHTCNKSTVNNGLKSVSTKLGNKLSKTYVWQPFWRRQNLHRPIERIEQNKTKNITELKILLCSRPKIFSPLSSIVPKILKRVILKHSSRLSAFIHQEFQWSTATLRFLQSSPDFQSTFTCNLMNV